MWFCWIHFNDLFLSSFRITFSCNYLTYLQRPSTRDSQVFRRLQESSLVSMLPKNLLQSYPQSITTWVVSPLTTRLKFLTKTKTETIRSSLVCLLLVRTPYLISSSSVELLLRPSRNTLNLVLLTRISPRMLVKRLLQDSTDWDTQTDHTQLITSELPCKRPCNVTQPSLELRNLWLKVSRSLKVSMSNPTILRLSTEVSSGTLISWRLLNWRIFLVNNCYFYTVIRFLKIVYCFW